MQDISFEGNIGMMHKLAGKYYRRAKALGVGYEYDDIMQEMFLAWRKAADGFDESRGFRFSTYFYRVANVHANREIFKDHRDDGHLEVNHVSIQSPSFSEEHSSLEELLQDELAQSTEETVEVYDEVNALLRNVSQPTALVIKYLVDPPQELMEEIDMRANRVNGGYAKGVGIANVSLFVRRLMGLNSFSYQKMRTELRDVAAKLGFFDTGEQL